jgi:hypothetical protein
LLTKDKVLRKVRSCGILAEPYKNLEAACPAARKSGSILPGPMWAKVNGLLVSTEVKKSKQSYEF